MSLNNTISSVTEIVRGLIDDNIRTDGRDSEIYQTNNIFNISEDFISSSTIAVFQNATQLSTDDWSYDSDNNQVTISPVTSGVSLNANDTILITYNYYKKYSDIEIKAYIKSALSYFVQHRYKKTFEVNSNDYIITVDGINPTKEELYIVALISSILIDPQNVDIRIPDLQLSAKRQDSDQEQIATVFRNFKKFIGAVDFYLLDNLD